MQRRKFLTHSLGALAATTFGQSVYSAQLPPPRRLLLAKKLQPGMTVGVIAPSSAPFESSEVQIALEIVESLGFKAQPGQNLYERRGYLAGTDEQRAADLNAMFANPDIDAIFCLQGGYGALRILPLIDYAAIKANPKIILGYSDVTALLNAIHRLTGLVTFHGPIARQTFTDYTYSALRSVLMDNTADVELGSPPPFERRPGSVERENRLQTLVAGSTFGHLVGGNLSLLVAMLGTAYEPLFDKAILVLEDVDEAPYRIDRMLTHLHLAGVFQRVNGVVLGKFTNSYTENPSLSLGELFTERFETLNIPVLRGLMIGHVSDQATLPIGAKAYLDSSKLSLRSAGAYLAD